MALPLIGMTQLTSFWDAFPPVMAILIGAFAAFAAFTFSIADEVPSAHQQPRTAAIRPPGRASYRQSATGGVTLMPSSGVLVSMTVNRRTGLLQPRDARHER